MNFALAYDDVTLVPNYSDIKSRRDPDTVTKIMGIERPIPIITSNMDTITEAKMAIAAWESGAIGALHRIMDVDKNCIEYEKVKKSGAECIISLGTKDWKSRSESLYQLGARYFLIDIAHGHSAHVRDILLGLREKYGNDIKIMAGNVATSVGVMALKDWGADSVKVGIGGGSVCSTRVITGFGVPMFTSVLECADTARNIGIEIVADGGIRSSGDIVKALVAGAGSVMIGNLLSGTDEVPENSDLYRGMSSKSVRDIVGSTAVPEGVEIPVSKKGSVKEILKSLAGGIRSGMSYAGVSTIEELKDNVQFYRQTSHGHIEGTPHGQTR